MNSNITDEIRNNVVQKLDNIIGIKVVSRLIEKSIYNYILVMDGDYQHNPIYINKMYNCIISKNLDVVVGCRPLFSKKTKGLSFLRINMSRCITFLINFIFGYKTSDPMRGFFIFILMYKFLLPFFWQKFHDRYINSKS